MKIKIKKHLAERLGLTPTSLMPVNELFGNLGLLNKEKEVLESLFNKDLLFYDLETTGLRRKEGKFNQISDMIHQIAILKYSPNGDPNTINAENPNDYYVAKASITPEYSDRSSKVMKRRAKIINQTEADEYSEFKKFIEDKKLEIPASTREDVKSTLGLFFHIFLHYNIKNKKFALLGPKGSADTFKRKIAEYISTIDFENEQEREKLEKIIDETNPTKEQLIFFYDNIFSEDSIDGGVSTFYKIRGEDFVKQTVDKIVLMLKQTTDENKVFTNYDDFPLKKYQSKDYKGPVTEKEALEGMMKFIDQQGTPSTNPSQPNGDYVLVGQNIISFDNPFVIARCEFYGINNTQNFRNSYVYDTRFLFSLMIKYFKTLSYFYGLAFSANLRILELRKILKTQGDSKRIQKLEDAIKDFVEIAGYNIKKIKPQITEVNQILENLKKSGKAKGKLETLMKAFIKDAPKQTHTADDDCEKLAAVFIPAMQKFHEIYEKTYDFVEMMDSKKIIATYRTIKNSPVVDGIKKKSLKKQAGVTTSAAIGFEKADAIGQIRKKIVNKFVQDLGFDYLKKNNIGKETAQKLVDNALKQKEKLEGGFSIPEKIKTYNKFLNFTESEVIDWFETNTQAPGDNSNIQENIKRIKIKILKENKNA